MVPFIETSDYVTSLLISPVASHSFRVKLLSAQWPVVWSDQSLPPPLESHLLAVSPSSLHCSHRGLCFLNKPRLLLPLGVCTCCLECSCHRYWHGLFPHFLQVSAYISVNKVGLPLSLHIKTTTATRKIFCLTSESSCFPRFAFFYFHRPYYRIHIYDIFWLSISLQSVSPYKYVNFIKPGMLFYSLLYP